MGRQATMPWHGGGPRAAGTGPKRDRRTKAPRPGEKGKGPAVGTGHDAIASGQGEMTVRCGSSNAGAGGSRWEPGKGVQYGVGGVWGTCIRACASPRAVAARWPWLIAKIMPLDTPLDAPLA